MTEAEWLACSDPRPMLAFLRGKVSDRKLRLFACACCRRIWPLFKGEARDRDAVLVSERFADGLASEGQLKSARNRTRGCEYDTCRLEATLAAVSAAVSAANEVRWLAAPPEEWGRICFTADGGTTTADCTPAANRLAQEQEKGQAGLLRELFGNPFHPLPRLNPAWLAWEGGTVRKLAAAIYEEHAFDRLPILADALEEAGCDAPEFLSHLRGPGPHVRGCWALDLLLGRS